MSLSDLYVLNAIPACHVCTMFQCLHFVHFIITEVYQISDSNDKAARAILSSGEVHLNVILV